VDLVRKIYGPPGTGKTRELTALACRAAAQFGPERVAALTYTRAAAAELGERIAASLGLSLPQDAWKRRQALRRHLPWVGTIHSLAYRMADGAQVVGPKDITAFVRAQGGQPSAEYPDAEEIESYAWAEPGKDEVEQALALYAMARHRLVSIEQAYPDMAWGPEGAQVSPGRAQRIASAYADYKRSLGKIDFEDMLDIGRVCDLPVDIVLADEVQDNSPLLWAVLDRWASGGYYVMAGDPYQAIYIFSGAQPSLFIDHPGTLVPLGHSKRLTAAAADRAQLVLKGVGFTEREWLGSWTGLSAGEPFDGSAFWLARTGRLVGGVARDLEDRGLPYGYLRGGGPLERKEAQAYRALAILRRQGTLPSVSLKLLADEARPGWLPYGEKARLAKLARTDPEMQWDPVMVERAWGVPLGDLHNALAHGRYYEKVFRSHGLSAFGGRPATLIGTIHAAKGREADTVHLVTSWGSLPYQAIYNGQARAEACVAYVGLTRHRSELHLEPADEGTPCPFL
jgi:superfamily I DNA/RNA helicase